MRFVGYRHAAYDTPWWVTPSSRDGRFHRAAQEVTQYLSLHPLGPAAEMLRHNVGPDGDPDHVLLNLWVTLLDLDDVLTVSFDNCAGHGISAAELVGDDYAPTQAFADRCRVAGVTAMTVPSAALPGTENLVLFGARLLHPYLWEPLSPDEVPTGHLSDGGRSPFEARSLVRWFGDTTRVFETAGPLVDPPALRY